MIAVQNHAQHVKGMRINFMPRALMSRVVVMKLSEPSNAPTQNMAILVIHKSAPKPSPAPAERNALSGG